jgi:hypothetical protein
MGIPDPDPAPPLPAPRRGGDALPGRDSHAAVPAVGVGTVVATPRARR